MHEEEHAQVAGGVDPVLQPRALARLVGESGIEQERVQQDEAHAAVVERVEIRPERLPVGREEVVADLLGRHPVDGLVANVVVAGDDVQGHRELRRDRLEARHRIVERGQRRHRMDDVAEVHDEARGGAHRRDLGEHVTRPGVGEVVGLVRGGRRALRLVDVGVGDDDEGEPRASMRRAGGRVGHLRSSRISRPFARSRDGGAGAGPYSRFVPFFRLPTRLDEFHRDAVFVDQIHDPRAGVRSLIDAVDRAAGREPVLDCGGDGGVEVGRHRRPRGRTRCRRVSTPPSRGRPARDTR